MILWQLFRFRWLVVKVHFWSFFVLAGVRICKRSMRAMRRPYFWERWTWKRVCRWNDHRTEAVLALSRAPGHWRGDAHPIQQWAARGSEVAREVARGKVGRR
jgi:hypothetical protein